MIRLLKYCCLGLYALLLLLVLYLNYRFCTFSGSNIPANVQGMRLHLQHALHKESAAESMQQIFPEGFVFTNALYGLTWCDYARTCPQGTELNAALAEIDFSIRQLESEEAQSIFSPETTLPYGAFYQGWLNYVRGKRLEVQRSQADSATIQHFQQGCEEIARAWPLYGKTYLESYHDQSWPADNILCLATLALHDRLFAPRYQPLIGDWLAKIKTHTDPATGLIPHSYQALEDQPGEGARGSSQSLMLCFLPEIDSVFAVQQFQLYQEQFLAYRFGMPGIREYPKGNNHGGDIDSGPLVIGIGGAASIVGIRAFSLQENAASRAKVAPLLAGLEALLFPGWNGAERTLFWGKLPLMEAFMAWSQGPAAIRCETPQFWALKFQLISLLLLLPLVWWLWARRLWRKKNQLEA